LTALRGSPLIGLRLHGACYFLPHAFRAVLGHLVQFFSLVMLGAFVDFASAVWLAHRLQRRRQIRGPPGAEIVIPPP
jgi:hypothetical protein